MQTGVKLSLEVHLDFSNYSVYTNVAIKKYLEKMDQKLFSASRTKVGNNSLYIVDNIMLKSKSIFFQILFLI